ncbi:MAG: 2-C-methyl-D-erythritol 4-phosphate cytidylyltransferase [Candidatus Omnitrophica bacterium]|nr:2-C-methyl-D-erythritol 4-phosphate cytidylyltransferase [Candidatus Omnitrophota bacterium]
MFVSAIILAAGKGLRLKSRVPKPLVKINSRPIIIYSLFTFSRHPLVSEIILVANSANKEALIRKIKQYRISKISSIVEGGKRRQDSVRCGLKRLSPETDLVLVHDGARPFVGKEEISAVIKEALETRAAVLGVPVKCTIKQVHSPQTIVHRKYIVKKTLGRENLWEIQTPQVFARELILNAYRKFSRSDVTDDAALAEKSGVKISVVPGSYHNIKITTPEDLIMAKALLQQ